MVECCTLRPLASFQGMQNRMQEFRHLLLHIVQGDVWALEFKKAKAFLIKSLLWKGLDIQHFITSCEKESGKRQQNQPLHRSRWKASEISESSSLYFNSRSLWLQCIWCVPGIGVAKSHSSKTRPESYNCAKKPCTCVWWFSFRLATVTPPWISPLPLPLPLSLTLPLPLAHSGLLITKLNVNVFRLTDSTGPGTSRPISSYPFISWRVWRLTQHQKMIIHTRIAARVFIFLHILEK